MEREKPITTSGEILEVLENRCYRVSLPNGKVVIGFPSRELRSPGAQPLEAGSRVRLEMTPYDFSKARIVAPGN